MEISGLNAEEQSDISLLANWYAAQDANTIEVFTHYDAMIVLRESNLYFNIRQHFGAHPVIKNCMHPKINGRPRLSLCRI